MDQSSSSDFLKDPKDARTIKFLKKQNKKVSRTFAKTGMDKLTKELLKEMEKRIGDEETLPHWSDGSFCYRFSYPKDAEYEVLTRWDCNDNPDEEKQHAQIIFDGNKWAKHAEKRGKMFFLGDVEPFQNSVVFAFNETGGPLYDVRIVDIVTGKLYDETLHGTSGDSFAWFNDGRTFLYVSVDPQTNRCDRVMLHRVGTPESEDWELWHEKDVQFSVGCCRATSGQWLHVWSEHDNCTTEWRMLNADLCIDHNVRTSHQHGKKIVHDLARLVVPRQVGREVAIEDCKNGWIIRTNVTTPSAKDSCSGSYYHLYMCHGGELQHLNDPQQWKLLYSPPSAQSILQSFLCVEDYVIVEVKMDGLDRINVIPLNQSLSPYWIDHADIVRSISGHSANECFELSLSSWNSMFHTSTIRLHHSSPLHPDAVFELHLPSRKVSLLHQSPSPHFKPNRYDCRRVWVPSSVSPNVRIPLCIIFNKKQVASPETGTNPKGALLLEGYMAYGSSASVSFSVERLSLLDRGVTLAVCQGRGSCTLGRPWYDDGRKYNKQNSMQDFLDCADFLTSNRFCNRISCYGYSAGGLLVLGAMCMRPTRFRSVVAGCPFCDPIGSMSNDLSPLTSQEYEEWGNPVQDANAMTAMIRYSPLSNVAPLVSYPSVMLTAAMNDLQVQYHEPARMAHLMLEKRNRKEKSLILLKTTSDAGHDGIPGRLSSLQEFAETWAFFLHTLKKK